jgi:hypothetical protein
MSSSSDSDATDAERYSDESCQQIRYDGELCRAAALRGKKFCYYHLHAGPLPKDIDNLGVIPKVEFNLPLLDDATAIQATITLICEHLLHRRLEPKKAGILLYALQVASSNLGRMNNEESAQKKNKQSNSAKALPDPPSDPPASDFPSTTEQA